MTVERSVAELRVNERRLIDDLEALGRFGLNAAGGIDRTSFSPADLEARRWLIARCIDAGLTVAADGIGNLVISSPAVERGIADREPVWTGSHIDAVPNGGRFDGPVGVLAAIECLRRLNEEGVALVRPVRAVVYTDEEGNYAHLLGSSALARGFSAEDLAVLTGREGDRFADTFRAAGGDLAAAAAVRIAPGSLHATVELHIEQGPNLEREGVQIGVVTGIVSIGGGTVRFVGRADHAGTTPMAGRTDAVVGAAEFIARLPALAPRVSPAAVVTTGIVRVEPGGANVIAESVEVVVDLRDPALANARMLEQHVADAAREVAARHALEVVFDWEGIVADAPMHDLVRTAISGAAEALGYSTMDMPSGAGHDSQNLAALAPTGMIFVPSTAGRSHSPAEHTPWPDVIRGANTLLGTVLRLAGGST